MSFEGSNLKCLPRKRNGWKSILLVTSKLNCSQLSLGAQDKKLRKEETLDLLKKLGASTVDTSAFKSTKTLGVSTTSKRKALEQSFGDQIDRLSSSDTEDTVSDELESDSTPWRSAAQKPSVMHSIQNDKQSPSGAAIGAGLKRSLDSDAAGLPIIRKKPRINIHSPAEPSDDEPDWEGIPSDSYQTSNLDGDALSEDPGNSSTEDSDKYTESSSSEPKLAFPLAGAAKQHIPVRPTFRARSDFKDWAQQQINEARDFTPSISTTQTLTAPSRPLENFKSTRPPESDPLPKELELPVNPAQREAYSVGVDRSKEIQDMRLQLPIVAEEQKIMEAIHNNSAVVVVGSTGSGKTTQVPQFLYEAGYGSPQGPTPGMIGVTQPRRVAAVTMAQRVGQELMRPSACSYQIRFDSTVSSQTAIKFMTDGILIREIAQDFALLKYSAIVIDEAHERSVNTDILIGLISRIMDLRSDMSRENQDIKPLKLVIMSATLMTDAFIKNSNLFRGTTPPLVESEGRQYPVTIHFTRRTPGNYIEEAFRKVMRAHRKLPKGGILVFMTAQNEIAMLMKKLRASLNAEGPNATELKLRLAAKEAPLEAEDFESDDRLAAEVDSEPISESEGDEAGEFGIEKPEKGTLKALILPLYSQLPTKEQLRVFEQPPGGTRLIVLATNVAETSITIPGIRYVFDCGRAKTRKYGRKTGVQSFEVDWISKASALQRTGRAGRTGPGHCYRLYSSAVYERDFQEHSEPEILRMPVEGLVLQLKSMDLQNVVNFPFPTPPKRESIAKAEKLLSYLGAINRDGRATTLGRELSAYPVSPRFSKILAISNQHDCMYLAVAMVAALATPEMFVAEHQLDLGINEDDDAVYTQEQRLEDTERENRRKEYNRAQQFFSNQDKHSDVLKVLSAFCAYAWAKEYEDSESFCMRMFLRPKAMKEAFQLYQQLLGLVASNRPGSVNPKLPTIAVPSVVQKAALKQIAAAGFLDQVALRADLAPSPPEMSRKPKRAIDVPYLTLLPSHEGKAESLDEQVVYIHPSSILSRSSAKDLPQFLVYSRLQRAQPNAIDEIVSKTRMHPLTPIGPTQLCALARSTPLLQYGKPIGRVENVKSERNKRIAWVVPSLVGEEGGRSWPLPALKVLQKRDKKGDWVVERVEK